MTNNARTGTLLALGSMTLVQLGVAVSVGLIDPGPSCDSSQESTSDSVTSSLTLRHTVSQKASHSSSHSGHRPLRARSANWVSTSTHV